MKFVFRNHFFIIDKADYIWKKIFFNFFRAKLINPKMNIYIND